jgi:hypothetical protein
MNTLRMRLFCLFSPNCLLWLFVVGGGGYFLISAFGESQVAGFPLDSPYLEPMEVFIKERLSGRYSAIATAWFFSMLALSWGYIGRQLKRAERLC